MTRFSLAVAALGLSLISAACSDSRSVTLAATAPTARSSDNTGAPPGCDYNAVRSSASYFHADQEAVLALITNMQSTPDPLAATEAAWPILRRVADFRLSENVGTAAQGKAFLTSLLACTSLNADATDFLAHSELVLQSGMLAVRTSTDTRVAAAVLDSSGLRTYAAPTWGVEPLVGSTWPAATVAGLTSYLIYGYPIPGALTDVDPATAINTNGVGSYHGFDLGSLPTAQSKDGFRVGICKAAGTATSRNRLIHSTSIQLNDSPRSLCQFKGPVSAGYLSFRAVGGYLASLVLPTSLYAQDEELSLIGGHVSDWSPFTTASLTSGNVDLSFVPIGDGRVGVGMNITVNVKAGSHGVPGVLVKLALSNNNGVPAGAGFVPAGQIPTAVSDEFGVATFKAVAFGKTGGYTITAKGDIAGLSTRTVFSNLFHIKK